MRRLFVGLGLFVLVVGMPSLATSGDAKTAEEIRTILGGKKDGDGNMLFWCDEGLGGKGSGYTCILYNTPLEKVGEILGKGLRFDGFIVFGIGALSDLDFTKKFVDGIGSYPRQLMVYSGCASPPCKLKWNIVANLNQVTR